MKTKTGKTEIEKTERRKEKEVREEGVEKRKKEKKPKKKTTMEVKGIEEKWEIWDEEEEAAKLEKEANKLVPPRFYKWIYVFRKKVNERIPTKKVWDYTIDVKKVFVPRKGKMYLLSREEKRGM